LPGKVIYKKHSSLARLKDKRKSLEEIPFKTMKVTIYALRWIFLLIFLFIIIGIFVLFLTGGQNYLQVILGYSITGFFTFFMGYFGWILAQGIIEMITGKEPREERTFSYYFTKKNKFNYR
jgi:Zn-dependent protease with chaperone function